MIESDHSHLKREFPSAQITEPDKPMEPDCNALRVRISGNGTTEGS